MKFFRRKECAGCLARKEIIEHQKNVIDSLLLRIGVQVSETVEDDKFTGLDPDPQPELGEEGLGTPDIHDD